jgi:hypothetical protein
LRIGASLGIKTDFWISLNIKILLINYLEGLLVYALIQRQVRLYLQEQHQVLPGNTGVTATPTAAVVFSLFTPVMLVQLLLDSTPVPHIYGVQPHHLMICDA